MKQASIDINEVFTKIPCIAGCMDWRRDRVLHALGMIYLLQLRGEKVYIPPLTEMLKFCCKYDNASMSITYLKNEPEQLEHR
jgi:hypothetical protein